MAFLSNHYSQKKKKSGRSIWLYLVNSSYIEHVFGLVNPGAIVHVLRLLLQLRTRPPLAVARVTWWLTGANSKGAPSQWRYAMTTTVRDVGSQQNQLNSAGNAQRMVVTWPSQVTAAMLKTPLQCNFFLFFVFIPPYYSSSKLLSPLFANDSQSSVYLSAADGRIQWHWLECGMGQNNSFQRRQLLPCLIKNRVQTLKTKSPIYKQMNKMK